jgi:hypothetical protein
MGRRKSKRQTQPKRRNAAKRNAAKRKQTTTSTIAGVSNQVNGYNVLVQKMRSATIHPLGFLLTSFLHPIEANDGMVLELPPELVHELDPNLTKEAYERRAAAALPAMTTAFGKCFNNWFASGGSETDLTKSLTNIMNSVWSDGTVYANHQTHLKRPKDENGVVRSSYSDILVNRKIDIEKNHLDPASLLIEVGLAQYDALTKADQAIYYETILLNKGLLKEPMLMTVLRVNPHKDATQFPGAQLVVFLVVPWERRDFRLALLWRGNPGTAEDLASAFARIVCVTEYLAQWHRLEAKVDSFRYLGPHCCRIGEKWVSTLSRPGAVRSL